MTKFSKYKDFSLRRKTKKKEKELIILKSFLLDKRIPVNLRFKIMLKTSRLYHELLGNKIKNRCVYSTKVRSVTRLTNSTKSNFKEDLKWGELSGFKKASW